jgi:hypothetical protein
MEKATLKLEIALLQKIIIIETEISLSYENI